MEVRFNIHGSGYIDKNVISDRDYSRIKGEYKVFW